MNFKIINITDFKFLRPEDFRLYLENQTKSKIKSHKKEKGKMHLQSLGVAEGETINIIRKFLREITENFKDDKIIFEININNSVDLHKFTIHILKALTTRERDWFISTVFTNDIENTFKELTPHMYRKLEICNKEILYFKLNSILKNGH